MILSLTSGMEFPKLDHAIAPDRVASATWQTVKTRGALGTGTSAANALEFRATSASGTTVYSVVLHPRPSKLKREQVREYIDHLGIPNADARFDEWARTSKGAETAYRYTKYAKTFVRAGAADASHVWSEPAGLRLEFMPQNDPTSLDAGSTLEVMLVDRGKPLGGYPVALLREGGKDPIPSVTDAGGRVRLSLAVPGHYMLRATVLEPSSDPSSTWDVHFTTMTFEVAKPRP